MRAEIQLKFAPKHMRLRMVVLLVFAAQLCAQQRPLDQAWDLVGHGKRAEAIQLLHQIIATDPKNADARLLLGSVLMEQGDQIRIDRTTDYGGAFAPALRGS